MGPLPLHDGVDRQPLGRGASMAQGVALFRWGLHVDTVEQRAGVMQVLALLALTCNGAESSRARAAGPLVVPIDIEKEIDHDGHHLTCSVPVGGLYAG